MNAQSNTLELDELFPVVRMVQDGKDPAVLTGRQIALLAVLRNKPLESDRTIRALAATLNLGKPAITRAVDTLSRIGWVSLTLDPNDHRSVFVGLTEKAFRAFRHKRITTSRGVERTSGASRLLRLCFLLRKLLYFRYSKTSRCSSGCGTSVSPRPSIQ